MHKLMYQIYFASAGHGVLARLSINQQAGGAVSAKTVGSIPVLQNAGLPFFHKNKIKV